MRIPPALEQNLERVAEDFPAAALTAAARQISETYRSEDFSLPALRSAEHRAAYLLVRMPATYAACRYVFEELAQRAPGFQPNSMLDLGAGPGTASWAATEVFPSITQLTLLERDGGMVELGRRMASESERAALIGAKWIVGDVSAERPAGIYDLVVISYALGELKPKAQRELLEYAWAASSGAVVVTEPGTRTGFAAIADCRARLIAAGAELAAPCPHHAACPMEAVGDWCHFAERLERTSLHRRLKGGELGYEDEKFSYVAAVKTSATRPQTRILRHPLYRPSQVQLLLCTDQGLRTEVVRKSQKGLYRAARKADWGSPWPPAATDAEEDQDCF